MNTDHMTFSKFFERLGGYQKLAEQIGVEKTTTRFWERRQSVPPAYWPQISAAGLATLEELAEAAVQKRQDQTAA